MKHRCNKSFKRNTINLKNAPLCSEMPCARLCVFSNGSSMAMENFFQLNGFDWMRWYAIWIIWIFLLNFYFLIVFLPSPQNWIDWRRSGGIPGTSHRRSHWPSSSGKDPHTRNMRRSIRAPFWARYRIGTENYIFKEMLMSISNLL